MRRVRILIVVATLGLMLVPAVPASGNGAGDLSGTLHLDGAPLAGVEVFLGVNAPFTNPGFERRFICTDVNGGFLFSDVPFDTPLVMIAGSGVEGGCDNEKFVDTSTTPPHPMKHEVLIPFFWELTVTTDLGVFDIQRIPDDHAGIVAHARKVLDFCFDKGNGVNALEHLHTMLDLVDEKEASGEVSAESAEALRFYGLQLSFGLETGTHPACPTS